MALFSVVFLGSTPIGGTLIGWFSERFGPRAGLVLGGAATVVAGLVGLLLLTGGLLLGCRFLFLFGRSCTGGSSLRGLLTHPGVAI